MKTYQYINDEFTKAEITRLVKADEYFTASATLGITNSIAVSIHGYLDSSDSVIASWSVDGEVKSVHICKVEWSNMTFRIGQHRFKISEFMRV